MKSIEVQSEFKGYRVFYESGGFDYVDDVQLNGNPFSVNHHAEMDVHEIELITEGTETVANILA